MELQSFTLSLKKNPLRFFIKFGFVYLAPSFLLLLIIYPLFGFCSIFQWYSMPDIEEETPKTKWIFIGYRTWIMIIKHFDGFTWWDNIRFMIGQSFCNHLSIFFVVVSNHKTNSIQCVWISYSFIYFLFGTEFCLRLYHFNYFNNDFLKWVSGGGRGGESKRILILNWFNLFAFLFREC